MANIISIIDDNGVERFLGNIEPPQGLMRAWKVYGDVPETPMFKKERWKEFARTTLERTSFLPPVHDQDGVGECNASATCLGIEYRREMQGLPPVRLSAGDLYGRINGGADQGSLLEDGLAESMAGGVTTIAEVGYLDWQNYRHGNPATRKRYRVLKAFLCPTFEHCYSAAIAGFPLISGVPWYQNYKPDSNGWLPPGRGGSGGHAICGYLPMVRGDQFGIGHQNSWAAWGPFGGLFVLPEHGYAGQVGGWWAIGSVVDEGGVIPPEDSSQWIP